MRDGRGQAVDIAGVDEHRGAAGHLGHGGDVRRDDGYAARHRFEQGQPESLVQGGKHEQLRPAVHGGQVVVVDEPRKTHDPLQAERPDGPEDGLVEPAARAREHQAQRRIDFSDALQTGEGLQQGGQVLAGLQRTHGQHIARREAVPGGHVAERRLRRLGLEVRLATLVRHHHEVLREPQVLHDVPLDCLGGHDHAVGLRPNPGQGHPDDQAMPEGEGPGQDERDHVVNRDDVLAGLADEGNSDVVHTVKDIDAHAPQRGRDQCQRPDHAALGAQEALLAGPPKLLHHVAGRLGTGEDDEVQIRTARGRFREHRPRQVDRVPPGTPGPEGQYLAVEPDSHPRILRTRTLSRRRAGRTRRSLR